MVLTAVGLYQKHDTDVSSLSSLEAPLHHRFSKVMGIPLGFQSSIHLDLDMLRRFFSSSIPVLPEILFHEHPIFHHGSMVPSSLINFDSPQKHWMNSPGFVTLDLQPQNVQRAIAIIQQLVPGIKFKLLKTKGQACEEPGEAVETDGSIGGNGNGGI